MVERSKELTPPIADFLLQLEETRSIFAKGMFPANGWIAPASDGGSGCDVRTWDRNVGLKVIRCPTPLKVVACLNKLETAALSSPAVGRHISHHFYKVYFEVVEARRPRSWTSEEARLCGVGRRIDAAMTKYNAILRDRANVSVPRLRAATYRVDRLIRQANAIYEGIKNGQNLRTSAHLDTSGDSSDFIQNFRAGRSGPAARNL
jgi:hypothetical protein